MKNSQSTSASYMWEIHIVHILHKKYEMTYIIYMVFSSVSMQAFLTSINISTWVTLICIYPTTDLFVTIIIPLTVKHTITHFTTPFLKTCDMWWKWLKWKYIQNHDIDHHKNYHDYNHHNHHQNDHNIKTVQ